MRSSSRSGPCRSIRLFPGLDRDNVYGVRDVDSGRKKVSGKVVVCGGGASGCESALALAMEGCEVTLVDRVPVDRVWPPA